jgi:predicted RNase H-like HicB family nuclease
LTTPAHNNSAGAREFNVIIERDEEGYYVASVPELHGCHTQAKSLDELMLRVREAIQVCLDAQGEPACRPEYREKSDLPNETP